MPQQPLTPEAGAEPIPGYRLLEPLGRGGFGEVWKCEAPGGLCKAIKFVHDGHHRLASREREALQRVKGIRHPFILSLERVEVVGDVLVVVMELADRNLRAAQADYQARGLPGIPRAELLGYLLEAAEALDWMSFEHGLQHLDIKPHNLFVVSNHLKVGDFGLVFRLADGGGPADPPSPVSSRDAAFRRGTAGGGLTPLYAAPEALRGSVSRHSDQYSLAIVYQQMLTGTVPFFHEHAYDLTVQHLAAAPDLRALPEEDRPAVARALAKSPEERFPSCQEFLQALLRLPGPTPSLRRSGVVKRILASREPPPAGVEDHPLARTPRPGGRTTLARAVAAETQEQAPAGSQPTSVSLPGYRFVECVGQSPLGDLWLVRDSHGRERRAFCLLNLVKYDEELVAQLAALRHPALPEAEVRWSQADRVVVLTDCFEQTLRDRFEQCQQAGLRGVPREELLGYLRTAARALDALAAQHGLAHLGLNPRNLFVDGGRLWVGDFGLVALAWLPAGQPAAHVNSRYAAPELFEPGGGPAADQYSLALIYSEMLTGAHPRPPRPSGMFRRAGVGSGLAPRAARGTLEQLPEGDRAAVARALDPDPAKRFPSCTALAEALEAATAGVSVREELYHSLPPVVPLATLRGGPAAPDLVLPSVGQLVASLTAGPESRVVSGAENVRYLVHGEGSWEYTFPVRLFPGAMPLKVEAFRQHWGARIVRRGEGAFLFQVDLHTPRRFWERWAGPALQVEVELHVGPAGALRSCLTEARVVVRPARGGDALARVLPGVAPQLLDSMRSYLQASPEQRSAQRVALAQPVEVYPVLPSLELAPALAGQTRNVSATGVSFRVPQPPGAERVYLHLPQAPGARAFAVLARVVRVQPAGPGDFEVGGAFRRAEEGVRGEAS